MDLDNLFNRYLYASLLKKVKEKNAMLLLGGYLHYLSKINFKYNKEAALFFCQKKVTIAEWQATSADKKDRKADAVRIKIIFDK